MEHQETKRLLLKDIPRVPFLKTFTWDAKVQPHDPDRAKGNVGLPVHYVFRNDEAHGLGKEALWGGKLRMEQEDRQGSSVFLGEDNLSFVPVGEEAKVYVGDSRDIKVTHRKLKEKRHNIRRNRKGKIVLYDVEEIIQVTVESFMERPVEVTILEPMPKEWEITECNFPYEIENAGRLRFKIPVKPRSKEILTLSFHRRNVR